MVVAAMATAAAADPLSTVAPIAMRNAKIAGGTTGFVPTRIYYGWALYVLVDGSASSFSADVSARIFTVDANVKAQAQTWGVHADVALRGLKTKTPGAVVIPRNAEDIVNKFEVATDESPQPILVQYEAVGNPATQPIGWSSFVEPPMQGFDYDWAHYRLYRDPRVKPGTLRVRTTNRHPHDRAVLEIFRRGDWNHTHRWEHGPASGPVEATVDVPPWPMDLVWVGHKTVRGPTLDATTGWTLDWERIK
jgi:hypothetical protein